MAPFTDSGNINAEIDSCKRPPDGRLHDFPSLSGNMLDSKPTSPSLRVKAPLVSSNINRDIYWSEWQPRPACQLPNGSKTEGLSWP